MGGPVEDVSVRTSGQASVQGMRAFMEEVLSDDRWRPGMLGLLDHRKLDWTNQTTADLRRRVDLVTRERERLGAARLALVVGGPGAYGLQRMMQGFSANWDDDSIIALGIFYSVDEARAWLRRFRTPEPA